MFVQMEDCSSEIGCVRAKWSSDCKQMARATGDTMIRTVPL